MFVKIITLIVAGLIIIHGLIHLIGFQVYAQKAQIAEMPFRTTFLGGAIDLGVSGTRIFGLLWLFPTLGFILAGVGFLLHISWWQLALMTASIASLALTGMDWSNAFRGTIIDLVMLGAVLLYPIATRFGIMH